MGPWYHGQWGAMDGTKLGNVYWGSNTSDWYGKNIELPFFDYHLRNKGSIDAIKEANVFFTGANEWKQLSQWPVPGMRMIPYFLGPRGLLSTSSTGKGFEEYVSDPAKPVPYISDVYMLRSTPSRHYREYMVEDQKFASRRPDVLVYQTPVLTEDLILGGPVVADLWVSISTTDADFVVKLIDVYPDQPSGTDMKVDYLMSGYQQLVRGEVMRGKFRNSFEKPAPFVPNQPSQVKFSLPDVAHTFKKGHRLMIQVQSSWFPIVDRNPQQFLNIYQAKDEDFIKSTIRVHHRSKIELPVVSGPF